MAFPTTYNKREMKIARKVISLLTKFGGRFDDGTISLAIKELLAAWDYATSDRFYVPSIDARDYRNIGKYLTKKFRWVMKADHCAQLMVAHHLAVALVKK